MEINSYGYINTAIVFLIGGLYSFGELLNTFRTARTFFDGGWGIFYVVLNGLISVLALVATFKSDINTGVLLAKCVLAGTSALALLRTVSIPMKHNNVKDKAVPLIEIVLNYVKKNYNRTKYDKDFDQIKPLMKGVDYKKALETLPPLCALVLNNLSEEESKKMTIDIQKSSKIQQGVNEIKCINLGMLLERYVGYDVSAITVKNIKEHISIDDQANPDVNNDEIDLLINKYE